MHYEIEYFCIVSEGINNCTTLQGFLVITKVEIRNKHFQFSQSKYKLRKYQSNQDQEYDVILQQPDIVKT